jgi:hypothetical protein
VTACESVWVSVSLSRLPLIDRSREPTELMSRSNFEEPEAQLPYIAVEALTRCAYAPVRVTACPSSARMPEMVCKLNYRGDLRFFLPFFLLTASP